MLNRPLTIIVNYIILNRIGSVLKFLTRELKNRNNAKHIWINDKNNNTSLKSLFVERTVEQNLTHRSHEVLCEIETGSNRK